MSNKPQNTTVSPFNVSRDELLNLAADKLVDQLGDTEQLWSQAESLVSKRVEEVVGKSLVARVDAKVNEELEKIISTVITPMTIWGEPAGKPTSIRELLSIRARDFWEVKVDASGNPSNYGGEPRHKQLMHAILREEFQKAVKNNAEVIVAEFKKALILESQRIVVENINKLIK